MSCEGAVSMLALDCLELEMIGKVVCVAYLQPLHGADVFSGGLGGFVVGVVELLFADLEKSVYRLASRSYQFEIMKYSLSSRILRGAASIFRQDGLHQLPIDPAPAYSLHHSKMLEIVMRLEQRITRIELHEDAADAPDVAREAPAQIEDDLWGSIVPR